MQLATRQYACREVRMYPTECGQQLGRDPSRNWSFKSLVLKSFLGREHFGTRPCWSPSPFGIVLFTPPLPLPQLQRIRNFGANVRVDVGKMFGNFVSSFIFLESDKHQPSKQGKRPTKYQVSGIIRTHILFHPNSPQLSLAIFPKLRAVSTQISVTPHCWARVQGYCKRGSGGQRKLETFGATVWDSKNSIFLHIR